MSGRSSKQRAAATTAAPDAQEAPKNALMWAPITRIDQDKWEVEGVMTSDKLDTYGTIFDYDASKAAVQRWIGNVREQHDVHKAVGRRVTATFDDANHQIVLRTRVSKGAPDTWAKVEDGTLSGYSISAAPRDGETRIKRESRMVDGRLVTVFTDFDYAEVSLVDAPSNFDARDSGLTILRSADGFSDAAFEDLEDEAEAPAVETPETPAETPAAETAAEVRAEAEAEQEPVAAEAEAEAEEPQPVAVAGVPGVPSAALLAQARSVMQRGAQDPASQQLAGALEAAVVLPGMADPGLVAAQQRAVDASAAVAMGVGAVPQPLPIPVPVPAAALSVQGVQAGATAVRSRLAGGLAAGDPMHVQLGEVTDADLTPLAAGVAVDAAAMQTLDPTEQPQLRAQAVQPNPEMQAAREPRAPVFRYNAAQLTQLPAHPAQAAQQVIVTAPAAPETPAAPEARADSAAIMAAGGEGTSLGLPETEDMGAVESAMLNDTGASHMHAHGHSSDYAEMHGGYGDGAHSHSHVHEDGTTHEHPHYHAHSHHDHYGVRGSDGNAHSHHHMHHHNHEHYYRVNAAGEQVYGFVGAAPDLDQAHQDIDALDRAMAAGSAEMPDDCTCTCAGCTATRAAKAAHEAALASGSTPANETPEENRAVEGATPESEPVAASNTSEPEAVEPEAEETAEVRAGARISTKTRAGIHEGIMGIMNTCGCPECQDACRVYDPDGDGDDDSTPEGDTDHDYQRVVRATEAYLASRVRAAIDEALAPALAQLRAVGARLAAVPTADALVERVIAAQPQTQVGDQDSLLTALEKVGADVSATRELARAIASTLPQGRQPVLRAVDRPPLGDPGNYVDASRPDSQPGTLSGQEVALAAKLSAEGKLDMEQQIRAAQLAIQSQLGR